MTIGTLVYIMTLCGLGIMLGLWFAADDCSDDE